MKSTDYDAIAQDYAPNRRVHSATVALLKQFASHTNATRVLEVGIGTGNYARALAPDCTADLFGIDRSGEMLKECRFRGFDRVACARAERLPFSARTFQMIYSVDVVHHIEDRCAAAEEAWRVLMPGGVLAISTDDEADIRQRRPLVDFFPDVVEIELQRYPLISVIQGELEGAGFDIEPVVRVEIPDVIQDSRPYRVRAYSSMHYLSAEAFAHGLARLESDLKQGPIPGKRCSTIVLARKPMAA